MPGIDAVTCTSGDGLGKDDHASEHCPHPAFDEFVETIRCLRSPGGCPWDREQTHKSISANMIEEAYEAVDAIEANDMEHLREELGDVLLQVVLQSQIAADGGEFDIDDVCKEVNEKIVRRHPHVFGDAEASSANDTIELWGKIKLREGKGSSEDGRVPGALDGIPKALPALMLAQKVSKKAAALGFDWPDLAGVSEKFEEEANEFEGAYSNAPKDEKGRLLKADMGRYEDAELEFGDLLFTLVQVARMVGIDAESALRASTAKFVKRFSTMENAACERGISLEGLDANGWDELWEDSKQA